MKDPRPQAIQRRDYRPPSHLVDFVDLEVELGEEVTRVRATLTVRRNPVAPDGPLRLDGERMRLLHVVLDGVELGPTDYRLDDSSLELTVPERCTLVTEVEIEPHNNTELTGLYRSGASFCTQCEAEGFRRITYFLDRPDVMSRYSTTIVADGLRYPVLLSNGNRVREESLPDGRKRVRWEDPFPKPCYLFALVAADLRCHAGSFRTRSGRDVRLELWVEPANLDACEHAMRSLQHAMRWDEEVFGREYDLDVYMIVAVSDFNMAAMENKGLNIFNAKFVLARAETATDEDFEDIEGVIAHEYFHNWTGNRVTCRDWFQLTLKEGLTVFRDEEFTADRTSRAAKRIADVNTLRTAQFAEDNSPTAHPIRPESYIEMNNFYTVTVYNKGAEVIRMMHTLLGAEGFRRGMDLYFDRHDGQAVTCDEFRQALADATGVDLSQFERWYRQAGTPIVEVETRYDAAAATYAIELRQRPPTNITGRWEPMHIPVAVGLLGEDGTDLPLVPMDSRVHVRGTTAILELRESTQTFAFARVPVAPVPSLLRGFSAPIKLRYGRTTAELAFLTAHDADATNRWDAAQSLAEIVITAAMGEPGAFDVDPAFVAALGQIIDDPRLDGSLRAAILTLPDERVLAQRAEVVEVDAIHAARNRVIAALVAAHGDRLVTLYEANRSRGPHSIEQGAVAARRAKNSAMRLLCVGGDPRGLALAQAQFAAADNMTDSQAALQCLVDAGTEVAAAPLAAFYERWRGDPLVLDKWFAVQALSRHVSALAEVERLRTHPDFSLRNPNRARSLLGTFPVRNQVRFHDPSGGGYRLLADAIVEVDGINPQLASRLVGPLLQWRRFDAGRSAKMRRELERIGGRVGLSRDVGEMVGKALGG